MRDMTKSEMFKNMIKPNRLMRGVPTSVADCGVERDTLIATLRRTELLCNMPKEMEDMLLETMVGRHLREGAILFREGARGDSLVLKAAGTARVVQLRSGLPSARTLATLSEPAVLGQEAFYGVDTRAVTVRMLSEGTVFHIRRGAFADLVAKKFVEWLAPENVLQQEGRIVWVGEAKTRPRALHAAHCVAIDHLKRFVREVSAEDRIYCCAKDDTVAAFAAFLFSQRGLQAMAVRNGRKLSLSPLGNQAA